MSASISVRALSSVWNRAGRKNESHSNLLFGFHPTPLHAELAEGSICPLLYLDILFLSLRHAVKEHGLTTLPSSNTELQVRVQQRLMGVHLFFWEE